eukprot:RCo008739
MLHVPHAAPSGAQKAPPGAEEANRHKLCLHPRRDLEKGTPSAANVGLDEALGCSVVDEHLRVPENLLAGRRFSDVGRRRKRHIPKAHLRGTQRGPGDVPPMGRRRTQLVTAVKEVFREPDVLAPPLRPRMGPGSARSDLTVNGKDCAPKPLPFSSALRIKRSAALHEGTEHVLQEVLGQAKCGGAAQGELRRVPDALPPKKAHHHPPRVDKVDVGIVGAAGVWGARREEEEEEEERQREVGRIPTLPLVLGTTG